MFKSKKNKIIIAGKSILIAGIFLLLPANHGFAQNKFEYKIIVENEFEYFNIATDSKLNPDNQYLQLDEFNYETRFYPILKLENGKSKFQLEPLIKYAPTKTKKDSLQLSIQELYTGFELNNHVYLLIGKQRLTWGTGLIWNPTNFYTQKDPFRLNNRLEGLNQARIECYLGSLTLNLLASPNKDFDKLMYAAKLESNIGGLFYSFSYASVEKAQYQFGGDFSYAGDIFTLYGEGVMKNYSKYSFVNDTGGITPRPVVTNLKDFYSDLVLGGSLNISSNLIFQLEYQYRSDYNSKVGMKDFDRTIPNSLSIYDPLSMGKHTLYGGVNFRDNYGKYTITGGSFYDPLTQQLTLMPQFTLTIDNFTVEASVPMYVMDYRVYNFSTKFVFSLFF